MTMDTNSPYDDWSKHIHAVITFLKPYFNDWRSYVSLVSVVLGIGILIMESQVLLRMRMGRWEILGYAVWCLCWDLGYETVIISFVLGPIFDIIAMVGIFLYCRHKRQADNLIDSSIIARLELLRNNSMKRVFISLPAQSGVVLFGKLPRDLWAYKWYLCILYIPVRYMLLELCDIHRDTKEILIPLEIIVDVLLYNGPFLVVLLRLMYWAWKVAYDEAVLTGAIFEDEDTGPGSIDSSFAGSQRRMPAGSRSRGGDYIGLAMVDLDEVERGQGSNIHTAKTSTLSNNTRTAAGGPEGDVYILEDEEEDDDVPAPASALKSPSKSPVKSPLIAKKSVMFDTDTEEEGTENEDQGHHAYYSPQRGGRQEQEPLV
ncbi:hypothetical protein BGX27_008071 [Mortierella sp. AM989]|nr:hypothetical protein BGX27_008071 [Mortierella sp. AM989]